MAERGVVRRPKRKTPRKRDTPGKASRMERRILDYLEKDLDLYTSSPGNHVEVAHILKTLRTYFPATSQESEPEPAASPPQPESLRRSFNFDDDDSVEDQGGGEAE